MRRLLFGFVLLVITFSGSASLMGQDAAAITGLITDPSGAVLPNAEIVLVNTGTNVSYQATSNSSGSYTITNVPPGPGYKITFSHDGFQSSLVSDIYLTVSTTRTQNARLLVGASETLEVSAGNQEVTINTMDASVGNNLDVKLLNELPVQVRSSPTALFSLQPGVTLDGAVTGARVDQNNITLDGLDVNDFATGGGGGTQAGEAFSIVSKAPVDSVQEFRGTVAGNRFNSGPGGGGQYQLVTKSGTNSFHGNLNEYHRDTSTVANDWFNNNAGVGRAPLIRNQFGGNLGGPVIKDKLFFFFNYYNSRIIQSSPQLRTVPLDSLRNGNVSYILNGSNCTFASRQDTTPGCIGSLTPAQVRALDPAGIGVNTSLLTSLNQRFPHANDLTGGDGVNTGGFRFSAPTPDFETNYVGRIDYNLTSKMKLFARFTIERQDGIEVPIQFPGDPVTAPYIDRSYAYVVGHTWIISPTKVNQFYYGDTVSQPSFPNTYNPQGINPLTFFNGSVTFVDDAYQSPVNAQGRRVSIPVVGDDFTWQKGNHNLQFGGTFKFIKSNDFSKLDYNTYTIGLGGQTLELDPSLRPGDIGTDPDLVGTTASSTYDSAFGFVLGRVGAIDSTYDYDNKGDALPQGNGSNREYRYFQTQLYFGDTWKITPNLTLSYGVNYQLFSVPYETHGLETVATSGLDSMVPLTFDKYFAARVAQSASGASGNDAVPLMTYILAGKANNGPPLYQPSYKDIAPRLAFAFSPGFDGKTVFNGGAGIVYDRTIINAVQYQQDQSSYLFQQTSPTSFGDPQDPEGSLANDPRIGPNNSLPPLASPPAIKPPYQPYVDQYGPYGLISGRAFSTGIDPALKTPYSIAFNAGFQHEFPAGFVLKTSYVGRLGRRLLAQADANQIIDFADPQSTQLLSEAFANITQQLRAGADSTNLPDQPWFEHLVLPGVGVRNGYPNNTSLVADALSTLVKNGDFADFVQGISSLTPPNVGMAAQFSENGFYTNKGFSSYNGLLTTLQKNLSHGLQFDFNYTWSHSVDNVSLVANVNAGAGYGFVCDVLRPRLCRGNSDFDVTHNISADFTYNLPFGRGRTFGGNTPFWLNEVVGGWDLSGITLYHSGQAYGTVSSAFVAGYANNAPAIFNGNGAALAGHAHKTADGSVNIFNDSSAAKNAFSGPIGFNIGSRNTLRGPKFFNQDLGLGKTFPIRDQLNLKFRADAFNVFNHPSFNTPNYNPSNPLQVNNANVDITGGSFGRITSTASQPRVMQFALRLEF